MWIKLKEMFGGSTSHLVGGDSEELSSPSHHEELQVASTSGRDEFSSSSTSPTYVEYATIPNDKSGLGFNSNNKNKSKSKSNKKKGQDKIKDPAKLVCFKCKVEGHHVRSCPLKKKKHLSKKQQGNGHKVKVKLMLDLKLKIGHFPRRIKMLFPKRRNQ
ncbi:hypothetical protein QYE76_032425 [Lolium multiflorum]|uniref:CCHC-type domain-containing protein n=1 Tax=Lolium multiflorum TaxID=4521 RepID=A0AAD8QU20_LOLMU|nr:hypothetical protein QYE76_032425 [Lolium multiflorum]